MFLVTLQAVHYDYRLITTPMMWKEAENYWTQCRLAMTGKG